MTDISLASISRIMKRPDSSFRASNSAKEELRKSMEDYGARISELAVSIARNANRNTVLPQDVITAREQLMIGVGFHQKQVKKLVYK
ncbi:MAG: histone family protein [Thermoplasmatota archaeon]